MGIAFVQSRSVAGVGPLAYNSNVTIGDLLIVLAGSLDLAGAVTFAVSDTQGNVWTPLALVDGNPTSGRAQVFVAIAKATGANSVTLTTASLTPQLAIHEFSGLSTLDVSQSASGSGLAQDSGLATTTKAFELLFGFSLHVMAGTGGAVVAGAGWTPLENLITSGVGGIFTEFQSVSSIGTFNATTSSSGGKGFTDAWLAEIATFIGTSQGSTYQIGCRQHRTFVTPDMSP